MKGLDQILLRHGYRGRVVNSSSLGKVKSLFTAGYRPFFLHANQIDVDLKVAQLTTTDLGGGDVGLVMEISEEPQSARAAIKSMLIEMNSVAGAEGFGYTGTSPLKEHIESQVEEIIEGRLYSYLKTNSMWFFFRSKVSQHLKTIRSYFRRKSDITGSVEIH